MTKITNIIIKINISKYFEKYILSIHVKNLHTLDLKEKYWSIILSRRYSVLSLFSITLLQVFHSLRFHVKQDILFHT